MLAQETMARSFDPAEFVKGDEVHRDVYASPEIFELEMNRLFARSWLLVGHESQVTKAGDYYLTSVATRPTIIVRDASGAVHAFLNSCPHRGAPLRTDARGNTPRFVCPYHSWTFKTDGTLAGMPLRSEYGADFDWEGHCLHKVGEVAIYRGFLFVSAAPVTDLETFLGDFAGAFDDFVDRAPDGEIEAQPIVQRHVYRGNWKLYLENLNDALHFTSTHASAATALQMVEDKSRLSPEMMLGAINPTPNQMRDHTFVKYYPFGHSYTGGAPQLGGAKVGPGDPVFDAVAARRGEDEAQRVIGTSRHISLLYPSASVNARMSTIRIVRPIAVDRTEIVALLFKLKGAPESVYKTTVFYNWASGSPSSFALADDIEMFERLQRTYRDDSRRWSSVHRGSHDETQRDGQEVSITGTSEAYIKNQFDAWGALMREEA
ncbi:aromatic ring-hydroxylating oxygenase subunit alpha [Sphingomonas bisphenolicum]|uniref:Oxidoreductase n=1 Tax=Sphingomonas bisphenolicum TaxID=296544 RepID=A0ABN5WD62_9SPHN|nr:Rieske 2Fe-2S domain-containing protein [Sphingomonas bisphenolicum]BBF69798.1 oxidoreductase [Sphingomonas bisphenolicum]